MNRIFPVLLVQLLGAIMPGCAQSDPGDSKTVSASSSKVGGACEGCEAIYESPTPFEKLDRKTTLVDFNEKGTRIEISGIVYQRDGKTPAKGVVLYFYHTDQTGHYPTKGDEKGWARRHGYIRGWVKTDVNGFYQFYTLKPVAYPGRSDPAHIHITVKEPDKNEYWIDEFLFADDPLLTSTIRRKQSTRGGSGIITLLNNGTGILHGTRHIILGLHVPDYPYKGLPVLSSGLALGENCPAFDPLHLSGPDKDKTVCPMCKYGQGKGVMVWFNHSNLDELGPFAESLEKELKKRKDPRFRVFLVYMNPYYASNTESEGIERLQKKLRDWCDLHGLKQVALLWIPSPVDPETAGQFHINPKAKNTVFVYKHRTVAKKWVNIEYDIPTLQQILETL